MVAVLIGFELALASGRGNDWPSVASAFDRALKAMPWSDRPGEKPFRAVIAEASRPQNDLRVRSALARLDGKLPKDPGPTLAVERWGIYRLELVGSAVLLMGLVGISTLANRPRAFSAALVLLTLADGLILARVRPFDLGPVRPLVEQSPVLARLAQREPRGFRTLDPACSWSRARRRPRRTGRSTSHRPMVCSNWRGAETRPGRSSWPVWRSGSTRRRS